MCFNLTEIWKEVAVSDLSSVTLSVTCSVRFWRDQNSEHRKRTVMSVILAYFNTKYILKHFLKYESEVTTLFLRKLMTKMSFPPTSWTFFRNPGIANTSFFSSVLIHQFCGSCVALPQNYFAILLLSNFLWDFPLSCITNIWIWNFFSAEAHFPNFVMFFIWPWKDEKILRQQLTIE